jgi:hypothetical protein
VSFGGGSSLLTGGTAGVPDGTGFVGCIFCDGANRFVGPGVPIMSVGGGCGAGRPAFNQVSVPMPVAGTLSNLSVKASRNDLGQHGYGVQVNDSCLPSGGGTGTFGLPCNTWNPSRVDNCQSSPTDTLHVNAGDRIAFIIGDGGGTFDDGSFTTRFSVVFTPDSIESPAWQEYEAVLGFRWRTLSPPRTISFQ